MKRLIFVATVGLAISTQQSRQSAEWPAPHGGAHGLAYDSRRGLTMLYGGDPGRDSAALWGWDGARWHLLSEAGPGMRRHIKLAYDESRDRLVLYGGFDASNNGPRSDTWEWDGERWARVATEGPGPRALYSMVYDPINRQTVLFGGNGPDGTMNDTWLWNGRTWTKAAADGPGHRAEASAVFDQRSRRVMIVGGFRMSADSGRQRLVALQDTWAWDGRTWSRLSARGAGRFFAALTLDPATGVPLRIAGESDSSYHGDMWKWNGVDWVLADSAAVAPRHNPGVALDTKRKRVVLFGGSTGAPGRARAMDDLWEWDGVRWHEIESR